MHDSAVAILFVFVFLLIVSAVVMAVVGFSLIAGDAYCAFQPATKLVICKE